MEQNEQYSNERLRKNIEYYKIKEGITQKELQDRIGVGKVYLSRLLAKNSTQQPSIEVVRNMSLLMGVSMETLIYGEIEKIENQLEEKQKKFINRIIEETRSIKIRWEEFPLETLDFYEAGYDLYVKPSVDEHFWVFVSGFGREYNRNTLETAAAYKAVLRNGMEAILVELVYKSEEKHAFELYIAEDGKSMKCCTNQSIEDEAFRVLKTLWESITIDSEKMALNEIYDNYLKLDEVEE